MWTNDESLVNTIMNLQVIKLKEFDQWFSDVGSEAVCCVKYASLLILKAEIMHCH